MRNLFKRSFTLKDIWSSIIMIFVIGGCLGISILGWMVLWYVIKWLWGGD